jgi:signal transduction histidine kinase
MSSAGASEELRQVVKRLQDELADLRRSRRRLAEAAQADRRDIERELHDGVQQHLVALAGGLQRLGGLVDRDPAAASALLDELAANVREALDEATTLATRVYPPMLDGRGLASALRSAASGAGVRAIVNVPAVVAYPPEITATVYWTWVDALPSAAPESEASINLLDADGGLSFEITIPGRPVEARLERLRDRVEALDGRIAIEDRQGAGSRLQGWLPLAPA